MTVSWGKTQCSVPLQQTRRLPDTPSPSSLRVWLGVVLIVWSASASAAGSCPNGEVQYNKLVNGLSCAVDGCHDADPSLNRNHVQRGADNAATIGDAINRGVAGMNIFQRQFTAGELEDLATWITLGPSCQLPVISLKPSNMVFAPQTIGTASTGLTYVIVTNSGSVATTLTIANSNAAEFPITHTCSAGLASGGACAIKVSFQPSATGARNATLTLSTTGGTMPVGLYGTGTAKNSNTIDAVEYYYAEFDSYFVTTQPDEIVKLDNGVFSGWARTGMQFKINPIGTPGNATVCRFYSVLRPQKCAFLHAGGRRMLTPEGEPRLDV